jgi:hypothetical protein
VLHGAGSVFDVAETPVNLLGSLFVRAGADRDGMQGRGGFFDLAYHVGHVLTKLVEHQTRTAPAWVCLAPALFLLVPLLRVRRVRKVQILLNLKALLP